MGYPRLAASPGFALVYQKDRAVPLRYPVTKPSVRHAHETAQQFAFVLIAAIMLRKAKGSASI